MVMMCGPVFDAVEHVRGLHADEPVLVMLTPQGEPLTQRLVEEFTQVPRVALLCGHYEGFDERIRQGFRQGKSPSVITFCPGASRLRSC
jgi:tRNA (guanine37-N1)-methyltransferase